MRLISLHFDEGGGGGSYAQAGGWLRAMEPSGQERWPQQTPLLQMKPEGQGTLGGSQAVGVGKGGEPSGQRLMRQQTLAPEHW